MDQAPRQTLFQEPPDLPETGAPGLLAQILGVFTEPVPLFMRLAATPRWGRALLASMAFALAMVLIWAGRVDAEALLRPLLEQRPEAGPERVARSLALQARMLPAIAAFGVLAGLPALSLALASILWLTGRAAPGPGGSPSFRQALCAAVVPGLVSLPKALLVGTLCLVRPVHELGPDRISPLSLGALFQVQGRLDALLAGFDLFVIAHLVLLYLAARHIMGLRPGAALLGAGGAAALVAGLQLMNGYPM